MNTGRAGADAATSAGTARPLALPPFQHRRCAPVLAELLLARGELRRHRHDPRPERRRLVQLRALHERASPSVVPFPPTAWLCTVTAMWMIRAGRGGEHVDEFIDFMDRGGAQICQPDITMVGGFTGMDSKRMNS